MKKNILHSTLAILLMIGCLNLQAQCPDDNNQFGTSTLNANQNVPQILTTCIFGGEFRLANVIPEITYRFSTCGDTDFDTELTVYDVATGAMLGHNNDACGLQSEVDITVPGGTTQLRVLVDQTGCTAISTCMTLTATRLSPDNDLCTEAISLPGDGTYNGSTIMASENLPLGGGTCIGDSDSEGDGVWYTFMGDGADWLLEFPATAGWDPEVNVYTGACGAYVCETGDDDGGPGLSAEVTVNSVNGTQYWVYVHDCCGGNSDFTFDVTVIPTCDIAGSSASTNVTCPGGDDGTITVTATSSNPITYEISGAATQMNTTGNFTGLSAGAYVVSYYDTGDMTCIGTENITIADGIDNEAPMLTCPNDIVVNNDAGICGAVVEFNVSATDNCTGNSNLLVNGDASLPGLTGWSLLESTGSGNGWASADGSFRTSYDGCNDGVVNNRRSQLIDLVALGYSPSYLDSAPDIEISETVIALYINQLCGEPADMYYMKAEARDANGNVLAAWNEGTANSPKYIGLTPVTESGVLSGYGSGLRYIYFEDGGEDTGFWNGYFGATFSQANISFGLLPNQTSGLASGSVFPIGVSTVSYSVTDGSGNTADCSFSVTVTDNETPTITCGGNQSVTTSGDGFTDDCFYSDFLGIYTIDDNCANGGTLSVNEVFTDENGIIFKNETFNLTAGTWAPYADWPTGVNTAVFTVTDGAGLTASCSYQVTVVDDEAPIFDCPDDLAVNTDPGVCGAIVNYDIPTVTDNCAAPSFLPGFTLIGTHDGNTYFLSDAPATGAGASINASTLGGHLATITSAAENTFLVNNAGPYRIIGLNDVEIEGAFVWETGEPVTFTDWFNGEPNNQGNEDYVVINFSSGGWNDIPSFTQARYIVEFDALPIEAEFVSGIESGGLFPVGTTTVTYSATDESGNTTDCSFDVTVTDNEAPVIACTPHVSKFANEGICGDYIQLFDPIILSENCGVASITSDAPADNYYPVGVTIVTFSVEDDNGNVTTCETEVTVTDFEKPVIDCQQVVNVWLEPNQCSVFVPLPLATATDNCGVASIVNDSPGTFTAGNTFVLWKATDIHGNISYCETEVRVYDTTEPVITSCPDDITVEANPNLNGGAYVDFAATATDNCGVTTIHYSQNPNTIFPIGTTIVLVDATDTQGNHDYCEFTVTVTPIFSVECPDDIITTVADDLEGAFVSWNEPSLMLDDDCDCAEEEISGFDYLGDFGNSQYYLYNVEKVEWADALLKAQLAGGHLVTIGSAPENQWVANAIAPFNLEEGAWMGLNDLETETINEWVTGEPLTYENFHAGMPDDTFLEDVYLFRNSGEWEDKPVGFPFFFIMEVDCIHIDQTNEANADNGGFFPVGTTTVTYTVSDNCGNMDECTFDITVESNSTMPLVDPCQIAGAEGLYIESFRAGDYENISGDDNGYADFMMEPIQIGETTEIELTPGGEYADGKAFWTVWMDMNNDGDYYDNELIYQAEAEGAHNATFDMPNNPDLTSLTHTMRIALSRDHFVAPCGDYGAGEVEDYRVAIVSEISNDGCYLEFLGFEGAKEPSGNALSWVTQSDCKVDYYTVQHSLDGINFENIKKVGADNLANVSSYYSWTDDDAFNGVNYYRIVATTVELEDFPTHVIEIKSLDLGKVTIYPNPANEKANIDLSAHEGKAAQLSIYNMLGQQMWTSQYDALPSTPVSLDLRSYVDQTLYVTIQVEGYRMITLPIVVDRINFSGSRY